VFFPRASPARGALAAAAACVIAGGLAQVYVLIIGGQAYPQLMFPEKEVSSSFFDGAIAAYAPSLPEVALGVGGVALALALTAVALKVLPFLPRSLADGDVDSAAA
jgi:molybdopterin-containing oxidoreductase family membrane subunit